MTVCKRGDVILVNFLFSDETGTKHRPAVILSSELYNLGRSETIIAAITSNTERILPGDYVIEKWQSAGLLFPSIVTGILRTIKRNMISRKLGTISPEDINGVALKLRTILDLL